MVAATHVPGYGGVLVQVVEQPGQCDVVLIRQSLQQPPQSL